MTVHARVEAPTCPRTAASTWPTLWSCRALPSPSPCACPRPAAGASPRPRPRGRGGCQVNLSLRGLLNHTRLQHAGELHGLGQHQATGVTHKRLLLQKASGVVRGGWV